MVFHETTNLRSKTRHRYLETRAVNVCELTQQSELHQRLKHSVHRRILISHVVLKQGWLTYLLSRAV